MAQKNIIVIDTRSLSKKDKSTLASQKTKCKKLKIEIGEHDVIIDLKQVEYLSSIGLNQYDIAGFYGISPETFSRNKTKFDQLSQAVQMGAIQDHIATSVQLRKKIKRGYFPAIRFNLLTKHGYKEGAEVDVNFKSMEDVKRKIEERFLQ